ARRLALPGQLALRRALGLLPFAEPAAPQALVVVPVHGAPSPWARARSRRATSAFHRAVSCASALRPARTARVKPWSGAQRSSGSGGAPRLSAKASPLA